ncbi:MAG: ribosomal protein L11 methyltransferase [Parvicella sp.]|jgi:ribosomal protein L11 methyltransferase
MSVCWKQLSVSCPIEQVGPLINLAESLGAQAITQQNAGEDSYYDLAAPSLPQWQLQKVTVLFSEEAVNDALLLTIQSQIGNQSSLFVESLEDQNWETAWQNQYTVVEIDDQLWVCPSWIDQSFPEHAVVVKIDPGLAFGTGTHETTQLCMRFLKQINCDDSRVLDYGCGSGILAIAAIKLGAQSAVGVDIDPKAEQVSLENSVTNDVADQFVIRTAEEIEGEQYQVVIANILAGALIDLRQSITAAVTMGGNLILSGILSSQAEKVKQAYSNEFSFSTLQKNEWIALLGIRKEA